jgi:hypothetical protein
MKGVHPVAEAQRGRVRDNHVSRPSRAEPAFSAYIRVIRSSVIRISRF